MTAEEKRMAESGQTGWTGIVAKLIQQYGEYQLQNKTPEENGNR